MWSWVSRLFQGNTTAAEAATGSAEPILGIDLGTSSCAMAVVQHGHPRVLTDADGMRILPSVVARTPAGNWLVGFPALLQAAANPDGTLVGLKHILGRRQSELPALDALGPRPNTTAGLDDFALVQIGKERYPPEQMVALLLRHLRRQAERELDRPVRRAVIAVPVSFDLVRRQAVLDAARIAGFDTEWEWTDPRTGKHRPARMRLLTEPVAALLGQPGTWSKEALVAMIDAGATHLSWAVARWTSEVVSIEAQGGEEGLGGATLDCLLVNQVAEAFRLRRGIDLREDPVSRWRLREAVERARCRLSEATEAMLDLPDIVVAGGGPVHLQTEFKRGRCDILFRPFLERCRRSLETLVEDGLPKPADLGTVFLVGGLAAMPRMRELVGDVLGREPHVLDALEQTVAVGAAVHGFQCSLGSQGKLLLVNATTHTFGLEIDAGKVMPLISRNTSIPTEKTQTLATTADNQTRISLRIFQGDATTTNAPGMRLLEEIFLNDLPGAPAGQTQMEVTFGMDADQCLHVHVSKPKSHRHIRQEVRGRSGLTRADADRLLREVETWAREEVRRAGFLKACADAELLLKKAFALLERYYTLLTEADRTPLLRMMDRLREVMAGDSEPALRQALLELERSIEGLSQYLAQRDPLPDTAAGGQRQTAVMRIDLD